jgi:radical SAM protein with 4Fe4S-binding SPASM domain
MRRHDPYAGCNAGITHFHADPHGKASICKIGREHQIDLITEGAEGLRKLATIGDKLTTRHGGCSGCALQKTCGTCMPMANLYRQANAPLNPTVSTAVGRRLRVREGANNDRCCRRNPPGAAGA